MRVVFSSVFKQDLLEAEARYASVSAKLGDDFHERAKEAVRTIILRRGGDHVGPHGFRCRKCRPFPYLLYYEIAGDALYVLGLVQERRHPDHLKKRLADGSSRA